jgi:cell division protein FtsZ
MVKEGLVNLDFADVCSIMYEMGTAMIGSGQATGEGRALHAAEAAIANPLLDETSMRDARGLLVSITGSRDLTLYELDEAAGRIRQEVDDETNIIVGATFDDAVGDGVRVSVVATGVDRTAADVIPFPEPGERRKADEQDTQENPQPPRHPSLLERLGVTVTERWQDRRASGWR